MTRPIEVRAVRVAQGANYKPRRTAITRTKIAPLGDAVHVAVRREITRCVGKQPLSLVFMMHLTGQPSLVSTLLRSG